jgi:tRNA(Ile)-lysidine synthetase-like protein
MPADPASEASSAGGLPLRPPKSDPAVREIVRSWRSLTGGARTLVALSAGADSSALALALATATGDLVIAHIVHDLRPPQETGADRDAARALADRLGLPFVEDAIGVSESTGNEEDNARKARYTALATLAAAHDCRFIAAGHHADDALETTLMSLLRGASLRGLAGIPDCRRIAGTQALLVRPMLGVSHDDCRRICAECGWAWREDLTNTDTRRLRAALRHAVIPLLVALRPGAAQRVARASQTLHDAAGLVEDAAAELWALAGTETTPDGAITRAWWARPEMGAGRAVVLGETLRHAIRRMAGGEGLDRVGARELDRVARAIRDSSTEPRRYEWATLIVLVDAHTVSLVRKEADGG